MAIYKDAEREVVVVADELEPEDHGVIAKLFIVLAIILSVVLFPLSVWVSFTKIQTYERGIVLRLGKPVKKRGQLLLGSGLVAKIPLIDTVLKMDIRLKTVLIPPQEVLTRDAVTVGVDAIVFMRVTDASLALLQVQNADQSAQLLAISCLRNIIGTYELVHLLTNREEIDEKMRNSLDNATIPWGIKVERVEIKDVSLPHDMQRAMAAEAQATRAANAKVIAAEGEYQASEKLQQAAQQLMRCPAAMQLRYLQTLSTIAQEHNSTILFPMPIDILSVFMKQT